MTRSLALGIAIGIFVFASSDARAVSEGVVKEEFIFEKAPFASCHASTIAEGKEGLVAAWFGGKQEGAPDVEIWVSRQEGQAWSAPVEAATGAQADGKRHPCWNPVLHQTPGPMLLFFKVGPSPRTWWGMLTTSGDGGKTWSPPARLPDGMLGPIKNKPVRLADNTLLCPSSTEDDGWRIHMEFSRNRGQDWSKIPSLNDPKTFGLIQPSVLVHAQDRIQILCRSRQKRIVEAWSKDQGKTWTDIRATDLPNPNSGIDATMLKDGRALLVYNHTASGRSPLNVAVSPDGKTWQGAAVLEDQPGEYSYPAVIQTADGLVHVTYTWKRQRIKHVVLDPAKLKLHEMVGGQWPK